MTIKYLSLTFTLVWWFRKVFSCHLSVPWEFLIVCSITTSKAFYLSQNLHLSFQPPFLVVKFTICQIYHQVLNTQTQKPYSKTLESLLTYPFFLLHISNKSVMLICCFTILLLSYLLDHHVSLGLFHLILGLRQLFSNRPSCLQFFYSSAQPAYYIPEIVHETQPFKVIKTLFTIKVLNEAWDHCPDCSQ